MNILDQIPTMENRLLRDYYAGRFWYFFRDAWHVLEPETPLVTNWHMEYICDQLQTLFDRVVSKKPREHDLIINIPPATTKSTIITVCFPVWAWITAPHLKFLTLSYDATLAIDHAVKARDLIKSEWFQKLFGDAFALKYDVNKKSEYANDRGGIRRALGVGQNPVGKHGDILICDDPIDPQRALRDAETIKVNRWWDRSISTRMTDAAVSTKIIVMQRLSVNDLTGHCLKNNPGRYRHICLPARKTAYINPPDVADHYDKHGGLLSPKRLNESVLADFKKALGSIGFAGQYEQRPVPEGGSLVQRSWIRSFTWESIEQRAGEFGVTPVWNVYIDGAYTRDQINDPTAILVAASVGGHCFIRHVERVWMELPELIRHIPNVCARHGYTTDSRIYVEPKASGLSIIQMLTSQTTLNVIAGVPPRQSKTERTKSNLPFIESGHLHILTNQPWNTLYLDELTTFPFADYDDLTDTTNMAIDDAQSDGESGEIFDVAVV